MTSGLNSTTSKVVLVFAASLLVLGPSLVQNTARVGSDQNVKSPDAARSTLRPIASHNPLQHQDHQASHNPTKQEMGEIAPTDVLGEAVPRAPTSHGDTPQNQPNEVETHERQELQTTENQVAAESREVTVKGQAQPSANCQDDRRCHPSAGCVSTPQGQCHHIEGGLLTPEALGLLPNPKARRKKPSFWRREPSGGRMGDEMACSWQPPEPDDLPEFDPSDTTPVGRLNTFKLFTGSFVQKWYDWDAPIRHVGKVNGESNFRMRGGHEGTDQVYKMYNFCMKAGGQLSGYKPQMKNYRGGSDLAALSPKLDQVYVDRWNKVATSVDHLDKEPTWYVDRKLILLPYPDVKEHHPAHALMRTKAMIVNAESAWPGGGSNTSANHDRYDPDEDPSVPAPSDVTVVYMMLDNPKKKLLFYPSSKLHPFTTLAARSHFGVFDTAKNIHNRWKWTSHGASLREETISKALKLLETPICFKEGVMIQSCYQPDCRRKNHDTASFPFFGFRQPSSQRLVARRLRACAGGQDRRPGDGPLVVLGYRSKDRGFAFQNALVPALLAAVKKQWPGSGDGVGVGRLTVFETNRYSLVQLIQLYTQVDIVLAPWSSSFLFQLPAATRWLFADRGAAPRGFIGIEVVEDDRGNDQEPTPFYQVNGLDRAPESDYGSMYRAAASPKFGVGTFASHIKVAIPTKLGGKYGGKYGASPLLPVGLLAPVLKQADCLMRLEPQATPSCSSGVNGFSSKCLEEKRHQCPEVTDTGNLTRWRELREESASSASELLYTLRTTSLDTTEKAGLAPTPRIAKIVQRISDIHHARLKNDLSAHQLRVSAALDALIDPFPRKSVRVLLAIACQSHPNFGEYVNTELVAWRFFLANQNSILISFDKPCPQANLYGLKTYNKERRATSTIVECGIMGAHKKSPSGCLGSASAPVVLVLANIPLKGDDFDAPVVQI